MCTLSGFPFFFCWLGLVVLLHFSAFALRSCFLVCGYENGKGRLGWTQNTERKITRKASYIIIPPKSMILEAPKDGTNTFSYVNVVLKTRRGFRQSKRNDGLYCRRQTSLPSTAAETHQIFSTSNYISQIHYDPNVYTSIKETMVGFVTAK